MPAGYLTHFLSTTVTSFYECNHANIVAVLKGGRTDTHLRVDRAEAPTLRDAAAPPHGLRPAGAAVHFTVGHRPSSPATQTAVPLLDAFFSHTESVCPCVCVCVCVLFKGPPNETLSEAQPVPLAVIMTTLSRTIER